MDGCDLKFIKPRDEPDKLNLLDLPALKLVMTGDNNLIMSADLTTGTETKDKELNNILYRSNKNGRIGIEEIKRARTYSKLYGKGLLVFEPVEERLYAVSPFQYQPFYYKENNLVKPVVLYQIFGSEGKRTYTNPLQTESRWDGFRVGNLKHSLFIGSTLCSEFEETMNPLNTDRKRAELMLTTLNELLVDVRTGGYGYTVVYGTKEFLNGDEEHSDAELFDRQAQERKINDRKEQIEDMFEDIMQGARKGGYYFDGWAKEIKQLERMVKMEDYYKIREYEQQITCEIVGVPPVLLGMNKVSRNVSVESLVVQGNQTYTLPERQKVENKVNKVLAPALGVEKIYFEEDEYIDQNAEGTNQSAK